MGAERMSTDNWVLITTTLFLGAVALFGPWVNELRKRWWYRPKLEIQFIQEAPYCQLTKRANGSPVYYFRFRVSNKGRSQAKLCEATLDAIETADASDTYQPDVNFSPVSLNWVGLSGAPYVAINPGRGYFGDLGHISEPAYQRANEPSHYVGISMAEQDRLKFTLDLGAVFFAQRDARLPGKHRVTVAVYSENARHVRRTFEIAWSGQWKPTEAGMYQEIVIA
jgi:hypothetical protein